ncbi:MAG TPA: hypothetical protein VE242_11120, partial [Chthoniobacterales bacterium]|nr:hypothetical protein [Chthoniobacterales bacterium]
FAQIRDGIIAAKELRLIEKRIYDSRIRPIIYWSNNLPAPSYLLQNCFCAFISYLETGDFVTIEVRNVARPLLVSSRTAAIENPDKESETQSNYQ